MIASTIRSVAPAACSVRHRGIALFTALIVLLVMALGGIALVRSVDTGNLTAGNLAFRQSTLQAADLGTEKAAGHLQLLINRKATDAASDNYTPTYGDDPVPPNTNAATSPATASSAYYLIERLCDAAGNCLGSPDRHYRVTVQVRGVRDTETWTQAILKTQPAPFRFGREAFLANGNVTISGNPTIKNGSVHSNANIALSGSPAVDGAISAVGRITNTSSSALDLIEDQPVKYVPNIDPREFKSYAEYMLTADGYVIDRVNGVTVVLKAGEKWNGWDFSVSGGTPKWTLSSNDALNGRFYIEGDAVVSGNPGQLKPVFLPWEATLLAEGNIEVSGNPVMKSYSGTKVPGETVPDDVGNLLLIAGLDLKINGNTSTEDAAASTEQYFQGIMAAHEQVFVSGNARLGGYIVAQDAQNTSNVATESSVSGNMQLVSGSRLMYPGNGPGKLTRVAWRELHR